MARKRSSYLKRALGVLVLLATLGAIVLAWLPDPVPVEIAKATRGRLSVTVDEDGRTRVKDRYVVSAPLLAQLSRIELEAGDPVSEGQPLARLVPLDPPMLDARSRAQAMARVAGSAAAQRQAQVEVQRARSALQYARQQAARQRALGRTGASSAQLAEQAELEERTARDALASAEFAARVARYELRMAELAVGRSQERGQEHEQIEVGSPVQGQVLRVIQESAAVVQPATPLLEIGDLAALEIVADVLTSDALQIRRGARAFIERPGDQPLAAHVRRVEPSAFTRISTLGVEEQRVNVILDLDAPRSHWSALGDGYRVDVRIETWSGEGVLTVPTSAVFRDQNRWSAYVVDEDGTARLVRLELGHRGRDRVEVRRGLAEGARVIVHPGDRVQDGTRVKRR
jgi:HlyD family secretion protein